MSKVKSFNCQKMGHFARTYTNDSALPITKKDAASMAFSVEVTIANSKLEWIADSGAISHMIGHVDNAHDGRSSISDRGFWRNNDGYGSWGKITTDM